MSNDRQPMLEIRWEMMDSILSGTSAIDVPRLYVTSLDDAQDFLACYGFDAAHARQRDELEALRVAALDFIENELLHDEPLAIDPEVRNERDIRRLLLWVSTDAQTERRLWACTMLRVMHTFAHSGSYFQDEYAEPIREQILARFRPHIVTHHDGSIWLGAGPDAIPLSAFDLKFTKSRTSLAMKLLHKVENVATDVFDWLGVRIVTKHRFDALLAVRYLRTNNVFMFANVVPGRSRNTLLDLDTLHGELDRIEDARRAGEIAAYEEWAEMRRRTAASPYPTPNGSTYNPYTALQYHSIQFTCRHMVRVVNPQLRGLTKVLPFAQSERIRTMLKKLGVETEVRFFFPFEVQIIDEESHDAAFKGLASHEKYKERQRYAVKKRLFGTRITQRPPELTPAEIAAEDRLQQAKTAPLSAVTTAE